LPLQIKSRCKSNQARCNAAGPLLPTPFERCRQPACGRFHTRLGAGMRLMRSPRRCHQSPVHICLPEHLMTAEHCCTLAPAQAGSYARACSPACTGAASCQLLAWIDHSLMRAAMLPPWPARLQARTGWHARPALAGASPKVAYLEPGPHNQM
jgi:hypothetical protein